jgi:nucleotidyltransferase substrate binding protein (TIGR01987 family)
VVDPRARYEADRMLLKKALATLRKAQAAPKDDLTRDAVIQRFEYVFELGWKTLQAACALQGIETRSPKDAIRRAHELGWLEDPSDWFKALEARNLTSHTYDETLAESVYQSAAEFPAFVDRVLEKLQNQQP